MHLTVSDLDRSVAFYEERLGLGVHRSEGRRAALGAGEEGLLVLVEEPGARPAIGATGLYHFALLVPSRAALARALARLEETGTPLSGAADHGVSEALYLSDPDRNGIEIYRDRPREAWPFEDGELAMTTDPLDLDDLRAALDDEDGAGDGRAGVDPGSVIGHVHLHVSRLDPARHFYVDILGFEVTQRYGPAALFVSAGGYHHHVGLNTWKGVGAPPPPPGSTGLRHFELRLHDAAELGRVRGRLAEAAAAIEERPDGLLVRDPSDNALLLTTDGAAG
ncbi:MAG TPA: VOC family protein [Thermoanaerobaculia bacterium]|nr:VOC family protein [Thermoanaerobaculia bacterium]